MHLTFEVKTFNVPIPIENCIIDNRGGKLTICLKSVSFWIGYYNISKGERIKWRNEGENEQETEIIVEPGLYNLHEIKSIITTPLSWLSISFSKNNGKIQFDIPEGKEIKLSEDIAELLSLPRGWIGPGTVNGKVDLQHFKAIYLHCHQISTTDNLFNGKPSTILDVIPLADNCFGSNTNIQYTAEIRKPLEHTIINELQFSIQDSKGRKINNRGLPVIFTLEIV